MHEIVIKNVDRYVWFGDQRKLDVRTMDGHIYRFYRVIDFEGKSYNTVYCRELEQAICVRFENSGYVCDEAWVYVDTTNSVLMTKKENNMLQNFIVDNVEKYTWNRQAQLMKVTHIDGSEELYYGVVEYCILSPHHMSLKIKIRCSHFIPVEDYSKIYTQKKAVKEVAKEVNEGKWGYGTDRIQRLEAAGYSYNEVQSEANRLLYVPYKPESKIENVIFRQPATIVFWADGTKTVVKCGENDIYDPEKGLAMAVAKKYLGTNKSHSNYMDEFKKWLPKEEAPSNPIEDVIDSIKKAAEIYSSLKEKEHD